MFFNKRAKYIALAQSYLYVANFLYDLSRKSEKHIYAFTSSIVQDDEKYIICKNICNKICGNNIKVLFVNATIDLSTKQKFEFNKSVKDNDNLFDQINIYNSEKFKLQEIIEKNFKNYDMILVNIPNIIYMADALEYAKICKNIILIEKHGKSNYSDFENVLSISHQNGLNIDGIITYR